MVITIRKNVKRRKLEEETEKDKIMTIKKR